MDIAHFLTFASQADIAALWGLGFLALALGAMLGETRRMKRARIDGVGWMPWRTIFLVCAIVGAGLVALGAKGIFAG